MPLGKSLALSTTLTVREPAGRQTLLHEAADRRERARSGCRSSRRRRCRRSSRAPGWIAGSASLQSCGRGDAVAVDVEVGRVGAGAVLVDAVVRGRPVAPGRIPGLVSLQSAGRRTPSPSASPSISSQELRASPSSLIAVSLPTPQSTSSARPSREMMLSSPAPPLKTSIPPPPNSPSSPDPPSKMTGSCDVGADRGDVVAAAELEAHRGDAAALRAVDALAVSG